MAGKKRGGLGRGLGGGVNTLIPPAKSAESRQEYKMQKTSDEGNAENSVATEHRSTELEEKP